jgi:hypothetical protein
VTHEDAQAIVDAIGQVKDLLTALLVLLIGVWGLYLPWLLARIRQTIEDQAENISVAISASQKR